MHRHHTVINTCLLATITVLSTGRTQATERAANIGDTPATAQQDKSATAQHRNATVQYQEWKDLQRNRIIPVKLYLPDTTRKESHPVVIFSHGLGGSREAAAYLGEYLASKGYVCVHIQHPGSDTEIVRAAMRAGQGQFRSALATAANGENLLLRVSDVKFVIDELERLNKGDSALRDRLDVSKIAVAGHSFGAGTALAICGQNYGAGGNARLLEDSRVKVGIYLSAPVNLRGRSLQEVYGQVKVPGLLMTGTNDASPIGDTTAADRRIPFDGISAPHQYLVNFIGGDHSIFGGRSFRDERPSDEGFHDSICKVAGAFLDAYLCNDQAARTWLDRGDAKACLGKTAVFEGK